MLGDTDGDTEADGLTEGDGDTEADGLTEGDGLGLGDTDGDGETDGLGEGQQHSPISVPFDENARSAPPLLTACKSPRDIAPPLSPATSTRR